MSVFDSKKNSYCLICHGVLVETKKKASKSTPKTPPSDNLHTYTHFFPPNDQPQNAKNKDTHTPKEKPNPLDNFKERT